MLGAIQSGERFTAAGLTQAHAVDLGQAWTSYGSKPLGVEGMQGLAGFEHHQIGDVDHIVDGTETSLLQPLLQPGRGGGNHEGVEHGNAEQPPLLHGGPGRFADAEGCAGYGLGWGAEVGLAAHQGCHLPGNALH